MQEQCWSKSDPRALSPYLTQVNLLWAGVQGVGWCLHTHTCTLYTYNTLYKHHTELYVHIFTHTHDHNTHRKPSTPQTPHTHTHTLSTVCHRPCMYMCHTHPPTHNVPCTVHPTDTYHTNTAHITLTQTLYTDIHITHIYYTLYTGTLTASTGTAHTSHTLYKHLTNTTHSIPFTAHKLTYKCWTRYIPPHTAHSIAHTPTHTTETPHTQTPRYSNLHTTYTLHHHRTYAHTIQCHTLHTHTAHNTDHSYSFIPHMLMPLDASTHLPSLESAGSTPIVGNLWSSIWRANKGLTSSGA